MASTPFFIFTMTRSGSTWFGSLLDQQPGVACYTELFLSRRVSASAAWLEEGSPERYFTRQTALRGPRPVRLWRYLSEVATHRPQTRAHGFKLIVGQLRQFPELLPILALRRHRMLLLTRENAFESAVSRLVVDAVGRAHSREALPEDLRITLDPAAVIDQIRQRRRALRAMRAMRRLWPAPSVELRYDDLRADRAAALTPALAALGIDAAPCLAESALTRRMTRPYAELIVNYDQLRDAMTRAGFAAELPLEG